jgi:hypothetical protein
MKKHSPEILAVTGVVSVVAGAVMACKATTKVSEIMDDANKDIETIHECAENPMFKDRYSEEDVKKDLTITYVKTGVKLVKIYAPAVIVGAVGLGCLLQSNNILRKRNVALAAAYATVDKGFKQYRSRVVERFGESVDKELRYNVKAKEIEETVVDEKGKEKTVKKTAFVVNPSDISEYARFFEEYTTNENGEVFRNVYWKNDNDYNLMFIKAQERYANDILRTRGYLFLNEVYRMLGLPDTKPGQVVGWTYDESNPDIDNFVSFGLYHDNLSYTDFVNGHEPCILIEPNVDGNIWENM